MQGAPITVKMSMLTTALTRLFPARENVLIAGQPGIGKTEGIAHAAANADALAMFNRYAGEAHAAGINVENPKDWKHTGFDLIIRTPVHEDPTDSKGMPKVTDAEARWIPFRDLQQIITARRPTVVDLEDLGQAPTLVQAGYMQLIQARRLGDFTVSPFVTFVSSTNRKEDRAGVAQIIEPMKSRNTIFHLVADARDWQAWALDQGLPIEWIAFVQFKPEIIEGAWKASADITNSATPRNVAHAAQLWALDLPADILLPTLAGRIGQGWAADAVAFLDMFRDLPSVDEVLANPLGAPVPEKAGVKHAICAALVKRATATNFPAIIDYTNRFPREFGMFTVQNCARKCRRALEAAKKNGTTPPDSLLATHAYIAWNAANADVLI